MGLAICFCSSPFVPPHFTAAQEQSGNESSSFKFPLRSTLATQQLPKVQEANDSCSLPGAQKTKVDILQQFLKEEVVDEIYPCHGAVLGTVRHCPAANCSQMFNQSGLSIHFPGYYWIKAENGSIMQKNCEIESEMFPHTSAAVEPKVNTPCPTTEQREYAQEHIDENVHIQLVNVSQSCVACTPQVTGLYSSSLPCQQL